MNKPQLRTSHRHNGQFDPTSFFRSEQNRTRYGRDTSHDVKSRCGLSVPTKYPSTGQDRLEHCSHCRHCKQWALQALQALQGSNPVQCDDRKIRPTHLQRSFSTATAPYLQRSHSSYSADRPLYRKSMLKVLYLDDGTTLLLTFCILLCIAHRLNAVDIYLSCNLQIQKISTCSSMPNGDGIASAQ